MMLQTTISRTLQLTAVLATAALGVPTAPGQSAAPPEEALRIADQLSIAFNHVAEQVEPSVVAITSERRVQVRQRRDPFGEFPSPFRDFFGGEDPFERFFRSEPPRQREFRRSAVGSGFIVDEAGHILTNNHVVQDADELRVRLSDGRMYDATVVGTDPSTDVAVLRIEATGLRPARLGDSDGLRPGQWVVAAGTPFGLTSTITAGIVSATGRSRVGVADYEDFIQTDAAINPGNSGGPLVNLRGEVVGINTAIFSRGVAGNIGIGFAIPINMARSIMDSLIEEGQVVRGWLGVIIQDLDAELAESFGYDRTDGALVSQVQEDSPAAGAGLEAGDIITHIDGRRIANFGELRVRVAAMRPGQTAELRVFRDGSTRTLRVTVGQLPEDELLAGEPEATEGRLGVTVQTLTPELAEQHGLDRRIAERVRGVIVTEVDPRGPGAQIGLRPGIVIDQVQNDHVADAEQFRRAMGQVDLARGVRLRIIGPNGVPQFITFRLRN